MNQDEYKKVLWKILDMQTYDAVSNINKIKRILPEKANAVQIGIHPSQENDGMFDIIIHLQGPDLYLLNKSIKPYCQLFNVKYVEGVLQPNVPLFDFDEVSFSVNDTIVEVSIGWINQLWALSGGLNIPTCIFGEECSVLEVSMPVKT